MLWRKSSHARSAPASHRWRKWVNKPCWLAQQEEIFTHLRHQISPIWLSNPQAILAALLALLSQSITSSKKKRLATGFNWIVNYRVTNEVFVTSGFGDIRTWTIKKKQRKILEATRILQPGLTCNCVIVTQDGSTIIAGKLWIIFFKYQNQVLIFVLAWDDGCIRFYGPQSGKLIYEILGAHYSRVAALAVTSSNTRLVSGGQSGQVIMQNILSVWKKIMIFSGQDLGQIELVDFDQSFRRTERSDKSSGNQR